MSNKVWPDEDEEQMDVDMKKWHWRGNPKDFVAEDDDSKLRWFFCLFLFFSSIIFLLIILFRYSAIPA